MMMMMMMPIMVLMPLLTLMVMLMLVLMPGLMLMLVLMLVLMPSGDAVCRWSCHFLYCGVQWFIRDVPRVFQCSMEDSAGISMAMKAWRASNICLFARIALIVCFVHTADVHVVCSLFDPSLKCCDANCDELASLGVPRQVKCSPVARCDSEAPPD